MLRPAIPKAILGGFVATTAMTVLMYSGPMMGMPKMDVAAMLGGMLGGWWMGMFAHFLNGTIIFPLIYAYLLFGSLPGSPWLKGTQWGLVLWFLSQAVVMPMMGMGFFSANAPTPAMSVMGSLIGHFIYGALLGTIAGEAESARITAREEGRTPLRRAG